MSPSPLKPNPLPLIAISPRGFQDYGIRSNARDGWIWVDCPSALVDATFCPGCSPASFGRAHPVPIGGNQVPEALLCDGCDSIAENPKEVRS